MRDCFLGVQYISNRKGHQEKNKIKKRPVTSIWLCWDEATWDLKVLRSFAAHCSNKVHVSVSTQRAEEMSHVCNWLPLASWAQLETWKTDVAFNQVRVKAVLWLKIQTFLHPKSDLWVVSVEQFYFFSLSQICKIMPIEQSNKKEWAYVQATWENYWEKGQNKMTSLAKLWATPGNSAT